MNKRQREIIGNRLANDEQILKELKQTYEEARKSINDKINEFMARFDATEDLNLRQSIIYQMDYQKALKSQIDSVLDDLNVKQFDSISKYLTDSYEDGFIGAMYDLHGQGIPLIFPIDQKAVIRALKHDSKLSTNLYTKLGQDVSELKKRVRSEITRGISQSYSYDQIARNIANQTKIGYSKAIRIARTESNRVSNEAALDAQHKAKDAGAEIVKQWDATLDKNTRSAHRILDGQIRELDEPFEVNGYKAMQPGGFGRASLDINCRCSILQRAKWAIDDEEKEILKQRDEYFKIDKPDNYQEFKTRYNKHVIEVVGRTSAYEELKKNAVEYTDYDSDEFDEMRRPYRKQRASFTDKHRYAITDYTEIDYMRINKYLRGEIADIANKNTLDVLDEIMKQCELVEDTVLYRGMNNKGFEKLAGIKLTSEMDIDEISDLLVGKTLPEKAFASTSLNKNIAQKFAVQGNPDMSVVLKMYTPKGTHGVFTDTLSSFMEEREILLDRGQNLKVHKVIKPDDNTLIVEVEVTK